MLLLRPLRRTVNDNEDGPQGRGSDAHHPLIAFPPPPSPCPSLSCTLPARRRTLVPSLGAWTQTRARARKGPPLCLRPGSTCMRAQSRSVPSTWTVREGSTRRRVAYQFCGRRTLGGKWMPDDHVRRCEVAVDDICSMHLGDFRPN